MRHKKREIEGKGRANNISISFPPSFSLFYTSFPPLSLKDLKREVSLYFLITKQKFSSKVIYFKGNKLYTHLTFIHKSTLHIFPYACRKTFNVGNKKEIYIQTRTIFIHK